MAIPEFSAARVLVVGDVMLDRYWFGDVTRISPEAPVPIVHIQHSEERPGGAANVARGAAALGAQVRLLAVIGPDEPGARLGELLREAGVDAVLHQDHALKTTVKLRVIGRQQQLLRLDFETFPSHDVLLSKLEDFAALLKTTDVVVLSDYGKGSLTHIERMIDLCSAANKPVLVDPKGDEFARYRNATMLTPNQSEFRTVVGSWKSAPEMTEKAQALRTSLNLAALLVTRSEDGMTLYRDADVFHVPAQAREVFDVSGAGDTVIATLAVMLASGATMVDAVKLANRAAGIVVGKLGAAVVERAELLEKS
ncbi:MAG: D-glycero-beta-D-manno-heptose-7-phosphate kinase [Burkholderiales bacterium]